jgi:hypothetical protein
VTARYQQCAFYGQVDDSAKAERISRRSAGLVLRRLPFDVIYHQRRNRKLLIP